MKNLIKQSVALVVMVVAFMQTPVIMAGAVNAPVAKSGTVKVAPGSRDIIAEIIEVVGLKPRFEVREANVENAAAVVYNGERYILYNREFLNAVNNAVKTDWAAISILAHEIGHHLNGHTLSRSGSNPADELEADEFSGFVLRKMGASLAEAQAAIGLLSEERGSHTHPGRSARLASISQGWNNANGQIIASANTKPSNKPVQIKPQPESVASAPVRTVSGTRATLTQEDILGKISFRSVPNARFYVTKGLNLVHIGNNGKVEVVGKIAKTNSRSYPFVLKSNYFDSLLINANGLVVNQDGELVGQLSA